MAPANSHPQNRAGMIRRPEEPIQEDPTMNVSVIDIDQVTGLTGMS